MIGTEQERDALMEMITTYGGAMECVGLTKGQHMERAKAVSETHLAAIRAMLAPDDAVLRERIRQAVKDGMFVHKDRLKDGSVKEIIDSTADAVWAVLRGEATRDENA